MGGSGVLDRHSAAVADTFDATQLDALPTSRSMAGVIGLAHGRSCRAWKWARASGFKPALSPPTGGTARRGTRSRASS